jgi:hypothetical protein
LMAAGAWASAGVAAVAPRQRDNVSVRILRSMSIFLFVICYAVVICSYE